MSYFDFITNKIETKLPDSDFKSKLLEAIYNFDDQVLLICDAEIQEDCDLYIEASNHFLKIVVFLNDLEGFEEMELHFIWEGFRKRGRIQVESLIEFLEKWEPIYNRYYKLKAFL